MSSSHELSALTGAYALDALDEQERAVFEAHLETCAECTTEVRGLRAAAAELSQSTSAAPPAQLRAQVLDTVSRVRPLPPLARSRTTSGGWAHRWLWPAVAAACVLVAVISAGWGYQQHRRADHRDNQASAIISVLDSPDSTAVTGAVGRGQATVLYSKQRHRLVLIGHDIPAPGSGKTYQLWMLSQQGGATSAGLFTPDRDGNVLVQATGDLQATARMGISVERAGGAKQPTSNAIVAVMTV